MSDTGSGAGGTPSEEGSAASAAPTAPAPAPVPAPAPAAPAAAVPPAESSAPDVDELAAALRADIADLDTYHRVLSATVGDLLPPGMVEVDRDRSLSDRMAGRPGSATAIRLRLGDRTLELASARGRLTAVVSQDVRGVTISRKEVSVAEWTQQLATYLAHLAEENAAARDALGKLLGSGSG